MKFKIFKVILIVALLISFLLILNRFFYGTWNVFGYPNRIQCFGRRYYKSQQTLDFHTKVPEGFVLPRYPVYSLNLLSGKRIYIAYPKGEFVPTVIFLYVRDGVYVPYALSGGP